MSALSDAEVLVCVEPVDPLANDAESGVPGDAEAMEALSGLLDF